jgi:hypothetical protein
MKSEALLRHLRRNGCVMRREGKEHSLWVTEKPRRGTLKSQIFSPNESAGGFRSWTHPDKSAALQ